MNEQCPWCGSAETPNSTEWTARFRCHSSQSRTSKRRQRSKLCGRYVAVRDGVRLRAALARIAELEAENERLRSRQGADDAAPLDDEWLTAMLGPKRLIAVENGTLEVMRTSDRDDDPQYVPWFRAAAMSTSADLRSQVATRGDVRALVAALGGAEREGQK